jgi:phage terminase small subunit
MNKLSPKAKLFVKHYRVDRNATKAAIAAGYSEKTAGAAGFRLLRKVAIKQEIERLDAELVKELDLSAEWVLKRLMRRANFDVRNFYREDGTLKEVKELDEETAYALQGIEIEKLYEHFGKGQAKDKGTLAKIKFADRDRALELLGRHLKLFVDKVEVSGIEGVADRLFKSRQCSA